MAVAWSASRAECRAAAATLACRSAATWSCIRAIRVTPPG
jgi:hypothetical protein